MGFVPTLGSVRIELNCWTTSWCQRIGELVGVGMMYLVSENPPQFSYPEVIETTERESKSYAKKII